MVVGGFRSNIINLKDSVFLIALENRLVRLSYVHQGNNNARNHDIISFTHFISPPQ
jgi:hypothetical protein